MCLISYIPAGKRLPEENLVAAHYGNSDGIGIMSIHGVEKFVGRKALKRARRYIRRLEEGNQEFAIHFRYATHGDVTLANCHPFKLPNGNGYLMHNGVLGAYTQFSDARRSDTAVYAATLEHADASNENMLTYWEKQAEHIGFNNKLVVLLPCGTFLLVNEDAGEWIDGIWYSQTYSLPYADKRWKKWSAVGPVKQETWEEFNPVTGQYEPYHESTTRGHYVERSNAWLAWDRDKHGNDMSAEEIALDTELAKHLTDDDIEPGCCTMCGMHASLDIDMVCQECGYELAAESSYDGMLPSWSKSA